MVETILLAFFVAKLKKYKLKPLFTTWFVYPVFIFTAIYVIFEIKVFLGDYSVLKFASVYKIINFCFFFILAVRYKQYISLLIGSLCIIIGSNLNSFVMRANGGKMPVFPTLSYITGYLRQNTFVNADNMHSLGGISTKYKFLADIFDVGYSVMSVGDIFMRAFVFILMLSVIKHLSDMEVNRPNIKIE